MCATCLGAPVTIWPMAICIKDVSAYGMQTVKLTMEPSSGNREGLHLEGGRP